MLDKLIDTPLSYNDLKFIYARANEIKLNSKNSCAITLQIIYNWVEANGYQIKSQRYWNPYRQRVMRYFIIYKVYKLG